MSEKKQYRYVRSSRTETLILLWIVMICCGFRVIFVIFNQHHSVTIDNEESKVNDESSTRGVDTSTSDKMYRQKRSIEINPGKIAGQITDSVKAFAGNAAQYIENGKEKIKNTFNEKVDAASNKINELTNPITNITDAVVARITRKVIEEMDELGVIEKFTKEVIEVTITDLNERFDKGLNDFNIRFQPFLKNLITYLICIWSMLGIGGSALGIFGIYRNFPQLLTLSVFFFYFTIVSEFLILSEINIDPSIARKGFLLSEVTGINWTGFNGDWMMMINFVILLFMVLSLYSAIVVKTFRNAMLKKNDVDDGSCVNDDMVMKSMASEFYSQQ